jgi:hypothetical protein
MLTTITAPFRNTVQPGARIASNAAVMSHAHANAKVEITSRASRDRDVLSTAAARADRIATSANTLNTTIADVIPPTPHLARDAVGDEPPDAEWYPYILPRARRATPI